METKELSMIEQLAQLRITAKSEIAPHEFLFEWNGVPCFAKGELVAVTGKAKSGKTYLNGLPMGCADSGLTPGAQNKEGGFNRAYVGEDGKIDKTRLFGSVLANKSLAQLRQVVMNVANVHSFNFAFRLIEEARMQGILQPIEIDGKNYYQLSPQCTF